jgi:predicted aspartyl protease
MLPPLVFDMEGWVRLAVDALPEELRRFGPCVEVSMQPVTQSHEPAGPKIDKLVALVDTGAGTSCLGPKLAARLGITPKRTIIQHAAGAKSQNVPVFRCKLFYPGITQVEADFAVLSHLKEPHEVVIGCDLLYQSRVVADFTSGKWEIHFKIL